MSKNIDLFEPAKVVDSQARITGSIVDGYRLMLICNHQLDNTVYPSTEDFSVACSAGKRRFQVNKVELHSPMGGSTSWSGIELLLDTAMMPDDVLNVRYAPQKNSIRSVIDQGQLLSFSLQTAAARICAQSSDGNYSESSANVVEQKLKVVDSATKNEAESPALVEEIVLAEKLVALAKQQVAAPQKSAVDDSSAVVPDDVSHNAANSDAKPTVVAKNEEKTIPAPDAVDTEIAEDVVVENVVANEVEASENNAIDYITEIEIKDAAEDMILADKKVFIPEDDLPEEGVARIQKILENIASRDESSKIAAEEPLRSAIVSQLREAVATETVETEAVQHTNPVEKGETERDDSVVKTAAAVEADSLVNKKSLSDSPDSNANNALETGELHVEISADSILAKSLQKVEALKCSVAGMNIKDKVKLPQLKLPTFLNKKEKQLAGNTLKVDEKNIPPVLIPEQSGPEQPGVVPIAAGTKSSKRGGPVGQPIPVAEAGYDESIYKKDLINEIAATMGSVAGLILTVVVLFQFVA